MEKKTLPVTCPSCAAALRVRRLECPACGSAVEGEFPLPAVALLTPDEQAFLLTFVQSSGNLKELTRLYGVSYPTVRNRLDALIEKLRLLLRANAPAAASETSEEVES